MATRKSTAKPDSVESALEKLEFTEEGLIPAILEQGRLYHIVVQHRMATLRSASAAKAQFKEKQASLSLAIRKRASERGDKLTEDLVKQTLAASPRLSKLAAEADRTETEAEYSRLLLELFRMRKECLRMVIDLSGTEADVEGLRRRLEAKYSGSDEA